MGDIVPFISAFKNIDPSDKSSIPKFLTGTAEAVEIEETKYEHCFIILADMQGELEIYSARGIRRDQALGILEMAKYKTMTQDPDED